jgi:hypothetical protein
VSLINPLDSSPISLRKTPSIKIEEVDLPELNPELKPLRTEKIKLPQIKQQ